MSRKALITTLFVTIMVGLGVVGAVDVYSSQFYSYEYGMVNSTNDEVFEETVDKINGREQLLTKSVEYVDSLYEKVVDNEEYLYGVKITTYNNISYNLYSDGYKEIVNSIKSVEVDNSNYNGSTATLKKESIENVDMYSDKINSVLNLTNEYRSEVGLNNLKLDKNLCIAASVRALEMSYTGKLSHIRPDGAKCFVVLKDLGINYTNAGENIGDGYIDAESVCQAWKESEGHYKNIVSSKYSKIGIGVAKSLEGRYYWVQIFSN